MKKFIFSTENNCSIMIPGNLEKKVWQVKLLKKYVSKFIIMMAVLTAMLCSSICSAVEMKQYTNKENNFSIEIPKACDYYIPTIPPFPPAVMYAASDSGYNITVKVFPNQTNADGDDNSLRGLGVMFRDQLRASGSSLLNEKLIVLDNGMHAILTSYTRPASYGGGMNIFGTTLHLWKSNRIYQLNYNLTSLDYEKYADSIRDSYQSFQLLN